MNKIKKGNLNFDQSGRAYPDSPKINENWNCIWENNGKYYKLVGDIAHKEWEEVDMFNQIIDDAYKNYCKNVNLPPTRTLPLETKVISTLYTQEEFINKCRTDPEFSKKWGLKIEERELSLEERNDLKLKLILEYLNKKGIITVSFEDFKKDEDNLPNIDWRSEILELIDWIDYGNELKRNRLEEVYDNIQNIPTKLITIVCKDKPKPPLTRLIKEGTLGTCPICNSTEVKRFIFFGKSIGCIQPERKKTKA